VPSNLVELINNQPFFEGDSEVANAGEYKERPGTFCSTVPASYFYFVRAVAASVLCEPATVAGF
jgi:hypothetical protein